MKKFVLLFIFNMLTGSVQLKSQTKDGYIIQIENNKIYLDLHSPDVKAGNIVAVFTDESYLIHPKTKEKIKKKA
ncbi:MAG: hypothetical protein LBR34_05210 [Prevotella sp.]|jgi:hypothetical protein|nr:hypothetical protein [Prevotella sp.]